MPVPPNASAPPTAHPTLGKPATVWTYTDVTGAVLGYACRFDATDGKQFRPLTLWQSPGAGAQWRWESWPPQRPLYGLHRLVARTTAPVVITEGEKAADAVAQLLPDFVAVTSPNGSKSASKADWTPLRGRRVTIWPDVDAAGLEYAHAVAKLVTKTGAESVAIISPPAGVGVGWDAADAVKDGWTTARALDLVNAAVSVGKINTESATPTRERKSTDDDGASGGRRRPAQRDVLIGCAEFCELWHDSYRTAYGSFTVNGHREHWPVRSRDFRMWLSGQFYEKTGAALGSQALEDGVRILEARSINEGPVYDCFTRVGYADGKLYLDLGDASWRGVEITTTGWQVVEKPSLKFLRSPSTRPLPTPEGGALIEELRQFINTKSDDDFLLVIAWIVAALRHRGPFPILVVNGEAGSGKSIFSRIVRSLVDPSAAPIRAVPRDDRDLVVSAANSWVLAFDNLSSVPVWLADALCRLATGSGFATRMLHTDRDEMIFDAARPIIINGIPALTDRSDLADRAVTIHLAAILEDERLPEDDLLADFERARPRILGALLDAVSCALGNVDGVKLDHVPRMADFCKWITAAESGLGLETGTFAAAYSENRRDISEASFEADSVAVAIWKLLTIKMVDGFTGTATALLDEINNHVSETTRRSKYWPQNAAQLGNRVARAAPLLKAKGCTVERRHSGERIITIVSPKHTV